MNGSLISYENRYRSDWVGSYKASENTTRLEANDEIVIGMSGTSGLVVNSLSLLIESE